MNRFCLENPHPIKVIEGEDKLFRINLKRLDGTPYDLTSCTLRAEVRDKLDVLVLAMTPTVVDVRTGVIDLAVSGASTINRAGNHWWDLRISGATGTDYLEASKFVVKQSVTN